MNCFHSVGSNCLESVHGYVSVVGDGALILAATSSDRDIPHGAPGGPVSLAVLTEVSWLVDVVVIEVAEFGV